MIDYAGVDLVEPFRKEFELCKLRPGEHVVILSEPSSRSDYVTASFAAAKALGAHVISAVVPGGSAAPTPSTRTGAGPGLVSVLEDTVAQDLLKNADLVIDLTREGFIHAPAQQSILDAGTRIIFICDAPEVLIRNMPQAGDKARALAAVDTAKAASSMHITSSAGTDLTVDMANCHPGFQTGFADDPGRWDHWPSTMMLCWPQISEGTIVLAPGDILLPFKEYIDSDVHLTVVAGQIEKVSGGGYAAMLEQYFIDSDDKWARYLSHMGWGLMRTADWFATAMYSKHEIMGMDARAYAGNFLWSTGPHPFLDRDSYAHLDIAMRGCTIELDGQPVVVNGHLIDEGQAST